MDSFIRLRAASHTRSIASTSVSPFLLTLNFHCVGSMISTSRIRAGRTQIKQHVNGNKQNLKYSGSQHKTKLTVLSSYINAIMLPKIFSRIYPSNVSFEGSHNPFVMHPPAVVVVVESNDFRLHIFSKMLKTSSSKKHLLVHPPPSVNAICKTR